MGVSKSELLASVIDRLSDPKRWTRGCSARVKDGRAVSPVDPRAESWCTTGCISKELKLRGHRRDGVTFALQDELRATFEQQYPEIPRTCLEGYNDHDLVDHPGLMKVFHKVYNSLIERGE